MVVSRKAAAAWILVFLQITDLCHADDEFEMCCLCDGCDFPVRGTEPVDSYGKTCNDLALEMADPTNGSVWHSSSCTQLKDQHYDRCCNSNYNPPSIWQAPTPSPADKYSQGSHPTCHLCKDGSYPGRPFTINAVLQFQDRGNLSCKDLYYMGLKGQVSDQLCKPMQAALKIPCGCGLESENGGSSGNSSNGGGNNNNGGGSSNNDDSGNGGGSGSEEGTTTTTDDDDNDGANNGGGTNSNDDADSGSNTEEGTTDDEDNDGGGEGGNNNNGGGTNSNDDGDSGSGSNTEEGTTDDEDNDGGNGGGTNNNDDGSEGGSNTDEGTTADKDDDGGWWKGLRGSSKAADPRMYMVIALWCILLAGLFYMVRRKINEFKEDQ